MALKPVAEMTDAEIDAEVRALIGLSADPTRDPSWQGSRSEEAKARETALATFNASGGQQRIDEMRAEVANNPARSALNQQWQSETESTHDDFTTMQRQAGVAALAAIAGAGALGAGAGSGGASAAGGGLTATEAAATPAMTSSYVAPAIATPTTEALAGTAAAGGLASQQQTPATSTPETLSSLSTGDSSSVDPNTLGALIQGGTSLIAGQQGVNAAQNATEELGRQFDIGQANMAPWLQAGTAALGAQQELMGLGPNGPEAQLSSLMSSPGYQFRLGQGERSLEASSAARGGMGSGKAGTAMAQFGQDYASNEYGNRLNQLAGLSGTGQSTSNTLANLGMNYAGEIGNQSIAGANARQSGILGAGSALSNWMNPQPQQLTLADYMRSR